MILKGSQRAGGQNLAAHLMRTDDNEHVLVHELRGFLAENLAGAFKEAEAVSLGTRCRQYLFSLSLSPPEEARVTHAEFVAAIDDLEKRLGLEGQPRAIVLHEKEGRAHAHAVWSRIDSETMTARNLPFFKNRLMAASRDLYLEHGWKMPAGMIDAALRDPTNFSLAEWQQAKRLGTDPRLLKQAVQSFWNRSDSPKAFNSSLNQHGLFMAFGDKRGLVVIDHQGEIYSLPRLLDLKIKDVRGRLGDDLNLKSVAETLSAVGQKMSPALRRHIAESRSAFSERSGKLAAYKGEMTTLHRRARQKLATRQREEWQAETVARAARLPRGLRGLWHRITGQYQQVRRQNEVEASLTALRHVQERQALIDGQRDQRAVLQKEVKALRTLQAEQLLELRQDIGRFLKLSRPNSEPSQRRDASVGLKLEQ